MQMGIYHLKLLSSLFLIRVEGIVGGRRREQLGAVCLRLERGRDSLSRCLTSLVNMRLPNYTLLRWRRLNQRGDWPVCHQRGTIILVQKRSWLKSLNSLQVWWGMRVLRRSDPFYRVRSILQRDRLCNPYNSPCLNCHHLVCRALPEEEPVLSMRGSITQSSQILITVNLQQPLEGGNHMNREMGWNNPTLGAIWRRIINQ